MRNAILFLAVPLALAGCATAPRGAVSERYPPAITHRGSQIQPAFLKDSFVWPVRGEVLVPFGARIGKIKNKGIDIKASEGRYVVASRSGKVVFCDEQFKGFGKTIILNHGDSYQTVYTYNSEILVKVGDLVKQNDVIAKAGHSGRVKEPALHFEIRKDGRPQNPLYYLPD